MSDFLNFLISFAAHFFSILSNALNNFSLNQE